VAASLDALLRVLSPLASQRGLVVERDVPAGHWFAGDAGDLEEMLGNLLDNACKWARAKVRVESRAAPGGIVLRVEDDGPGLDARQREAAFERGRRLDERRPGSGFGLAIVRELAEHHGGRASLARSPLGGLRAELELPGGDAPNRSSPLMRQNAAGRPSLSP
jgi:signal transduction histidine kinase